MLWFFGLAVTCFLAAAAVCFGLAAWGAIRDNVNDDYGARGIIGLGMAVVAAVFAAGAIAGFLALRST